MSRWNLALFALTLAAGAAAADSPVGRPPVQPYGQPIVSPYLNLLNRGNPAINYVGIVRPQIQQGQQLQVLQYGLAQTTEEATAALTQPAAANTTIAPTGVNAESGHAGFMTYTKYFNTVKPSGR